MNKYTLLFCLYLFSTISAIGQNYKNPVIPGFYPDPSICRVGDDFYLVNSTFEYFPGVPIHHSKDLINWQPIGHCLTRTSQLPLDKCGPSGGIYAPTLRHHEGIFYMVTTNVTNRGNFIVFSKNITGPWSEPAWIDVDGIDPSLYFEDGKCYLTVNPNNTIYLYEINPITGKLLSEGKAIWQGTGGRYPEGPHIYKKDDWYYLLISEGGTEYGHNITIARSKHIDGPYESNPANPILTHVGMNAQLNPIQGTGHGDLIQAPDGSWWMVCLAFRPQSGLHHVLGRETFLAPVRWDENAWPVINGDGTIDLEMDAPTLPLQPFVPLPTMNDFNEDTPGYEWNYLRNPNPEDYSLTERPGYLRLKGTDITLDYIDSPTFIARRQQHINFAAGTAVEMGKAKAGDEAGITLYMNNNAHYDLYVEQTRDKEQKVVLRYKLGKMTHIANEITVPTGKICLSVQGGNNDYTFSYSTDGKKYITIDKMDTKYLSSETNGGFTGVYIGLYAVSPYKRSNSYADFDYFIYLPQD